MSQYLGRRLNKSAVFIEASAEYAPYDVGVALSQSLGRNLVLIRVNPDVISINTARIDMCVKRWIPVFSRLIRVKDRFALFHAGDGEAPNRLCMDTSCSDLLIPDIYAMTVASELRKNGGLLPGSYEQLLSRWHLKSRYMFWRGGSTGVLPTGLPRSLHEFSLLPRVKIALRYAKMNGFDVKLSRVTQRHPVLQQECIQWLQGNGAYAPPTPESMFGHFRYYPDIPGNSLAWGAIYKYLAGCLVFKSDTSTRLSYYGMMEPWKHYIPVALDFSDLGEKRAWDEKNHEQAAEIAWNGCVVAHSYLKLVNKIFAGQVNSFLLG